MSTRLRLSVLLVSSIASASAFSSSAAEGGYFEYENCADQRHGLPLMECAHLRISYALDEVSIRHTDERLEHARSSTEFMSLDSAILPLAIPVRNYEKKDRWEHLTYCFFKMLPEQYAGVDSARSGDLVYAMKASEFPEGSCAMTEPPRSNLADTSKITVVFRYSRVAGVTSIAFPQSRSVSGELFQCMSKKCLFGSVEE